MVADHMGHHAQIGGNGLATADEMLEAEKRGATMDTEPPRSARSGNMVGEKPATDKQIAFIRSLCDQLGFRGKQVTERLVGVHTSAQASDVIDRLHALLDDKKAPEQQAQSEKIDATTKLLAYAETHSLTARLHEIMREHELTLQRLTPEKAGVFHELLRTEVAEAFATADLSNGQDALWRQQAAEAEREPGEEG